MKTTGGDLPGLHAAGGAADITPLRPTTLAGFSGRRGAFRAVHDRLEANAVVLRQGATTVAIVSCDLLYVGRELRDRVRAQLEGRVPDDGLFLAATHTHYGPMTQGRMPALGEVDPAWLEACAARISGLVASLLPRLEPAHLTLGFGKPPPGWTANRRLTRLRLTREGLRRQAALGPNPRRAVDETVRVLRIDGPGRLPLAVAWNHACHPTAFPEPESVSAEYPGGVRAALRARLGPGLPVLFLQGFAGDVRPPFVQQVRTPVDVARWVLQGPCFRDPGPDEYGRWAARMAEAVVRIHEEASLALDPELGAGRASLPLRAIADGAPGGVAVDAHVVRLSADAALAGLSAEPLLGLIPALARALPVRWLVPVGYIDHVSGYLPADADLADGGYEVSGFRRAFGMEGTLRPGIDAAVEGLLRKADASARRGATAVAGTGAGPA